MKNKKTFKKKYIIITALIIALAGAGTAVYAYYQSSQQKQNTSPEKTEEKRVNTVNLEPPTDEEKQAGLDAKKQTTENEEPTPSDALNVTLTSTNKNGDLLQIRSLISKLSSSGTCELHMTKGSEVITKTVAIQAQANSSTCQGFNIPLSELSSGTWSITLDVTIDNLHGQATVEVAI